MEFLTLYWDRILTGVLLVGVLLWDKIDITGTVGRLLTWLTSEKEETPTPTTPSPGVDKEEDEQFLLIIDLWHQLRGEFEDYGLPKAVVALDKVFPLLNDRIEEND